MTGVPRQSDVFAQELLHGLVVPAQAFLRLVAQNAKVRDAQTAYGCGHRKPRHQHMHLVL